MKTFSTILLLALLFQLTAFNAYGQEPYSEAIKAFTYVEHMPEFSGGEVALKQFIADSLKYPIKAKAAHMQGEVLVQFIVGTDGTITEPKVMKGVSPEMDAEALRLVGLLPKFIPGKKNENVVPVYYNLPVKFSLN